VADAHVPGEALQHARGENVGDETHGAVVVEPGGVRGHDAARLLPPMLQGIEGEVDRLRRLGNAVDPDHPAGFVQTIVVVHPSILP
jgi:hypothetical protein